MALESEAEDRTRAYRFAGFELIPALHELRRDGAAIRLQPRPYTLLLFLLRNRDRIVSREEILDVVWEGTAVGEEALPFAVHTLRRALGDDGTRQAIIQTVPRRGLRFVAPVQEGGAPVVTIAGAIPSGDGAFIGREEILAELRQVLAEVSEGQGRTVLLAGEAGVGKTRTAEEIGRMAAEAGSLVLTGRCNEAEGAPAFWPWVQIVRELVRLHATEALRDKLVAGAPEIVGLVPELAERLHGAEPDPHPDPRAARFLLFDSVTMLLRHASESSPLVVVVDDLHRSDHPSMLLFAHLARETRALPVLIVGTFRDAELRRDSSRADLVSQVAREEGTRALDLKGLEADEIGLLVEALCGRTPSREVEHGLHEQTNGNPFFVHQIVHALKGKGRLSDFARWEQLNVALPKSIQDAIASQIEALSEPCGRLLEAASIIGRDFALGPLEEMEICPREAVFSLLAEAEMAGIVAEQPGRLGEYRFSHVLVRDALYKGLDAPTRTGLHRDVARTLEALHGDGPGDHCAQLAHHYYEAALDGEAERALHFAVRAGQWACERVAFEEAPEQYRRALRLLDVVAADDEARRCELLLALGDAQTKAGDRDGARDSLTTAARLARDAGLPEQMALAALRFAPDFLAIETGVYDPALVELLEGALEALGPAETTTRARLLVRLAVALHWEDGSEARRDRLCADAEQIALNVGQPGTIAYVRTGALLASYSIEHPEDYLDADPGYPLDPGDEPILLLRQLLRITSLLQLGRVAEVDAEIETFAPLAERLRQPQSRWYTALLRATRALMVGDFAVGKRLSRQYFEMGGKLDDQNALHSLVAQHALLSIDIGGLEDLETAIERMVRRFPRVPAWRAGMILLNAELGRESEAAEQLDRFMSSTAMGRPKRNDWLAMVYGPALALSSVKHPGHARRLYELILPHADHMVVIGFSSFCWGSVHHLLGILGDAFGDRELAIAHFQSALKMNAGIGARPALARARCDMARVLLDSGRELPRAKRLLEECQAAARQLGMARLAAKARAIETAVGQLQPGGPASEGS